MERENVRVPEFPRVLGLQVRHFNFQDATISIEQRKLAPEHRQAEDTEEQAQAGGCGFGQPIPKLD